MFNLSRAVFAATLLVLTATSFAAEKADKAEKGFVTLFNGKNLDGWKASENKEACKVEDGNIILHGKRSHLFYTGKVNGGEFKDFEFKCEVKTWPNANAGVYFHTEYQESGWPSKGYEAQVNNTHKDPRKTGSLYAIKDITKAPAKDGEWWTYHIIVKGKRIVLKVNGKTTVDYTEPEKPERPNNMKGRLLGKGTFAFQAHDPGSKVAIRNVRVKVLD